jgi:LuxR family transcriptional regulator, quorum-sensing system regulator BjaR1
MAESFPGKIAFSFIEAVERCNEPGFVVGALATAIEAFGIRHVIVASRPMPGQSLADAVLCHTWPADWLARYERLGYFLADPMVRHAIRTVRPFLWREIPENLASSDEARRVMADARSRGIVDGFCVPIPLNDGRRAAVSFGASERLDLTPADRGALHLIAITAHAKLQAKTTPDDPDRVRLSPREREVLHWFAAGKSAWEISAILDVKKRTVVAHLENIRAKLQVASTVQAVVKALCSGELQPPYE